MPRVEVVMVATLLTIAAILVGVFLGAPTDGFGIDLVRRLLGALVLACVLCGGVIAWRARGDDERGNHR